MTAAAVSDRMIAFTPGLRVDDAVAAYWLRQAILRLRREIAWLWHEQGLRSGVQGSGGLPSFRDRVSAALDFQRFVEQKQAFFETDATAAYLTALLAEPPPAPPQFPRRGGFCWAAETLGLEPVERFLLALGLVPAYDHAAGPVMAACLNDPARQTATLALAQRLWDDPGAVVAACDPSSPLARTGLLPAGVFAEGSGHWDRALAVAPAVAAILLGTAKPAVAPAPVDAPPSPNGDLDRMVEYTAARLETDPESAMQLVPILAADPHAAREWAARISAMRGRPLATAPAAPTLLAGSGFLSSLAAACWLRGCDLFLNRDQTAYLADGRPALEPGQLPALSIPITLYLAVADRRLCGHLPSGRLFPAMEVPATRYAERLALWQEHFGGRVPETLLTEVSRHFRFTPALIRRVARSLESRPGDLDAPRLFAACRSEFSLDLGDLAQKVTPRFRPGELVLPPKQQGQFREILRAMQAVSEVHYGWGTERVWNEAGLAVLFAGASGTGKTMAAEILAAALDVPMYRIDLSQVVSKYIGETEKHLKSIFDAGEQSDAILFFDEADSLFGKRSEVRDAHDRYANLEISYLLERMERFQGLAILATNRKKDLDEAFLRRLRYILEFPLPGTEERRRIWRQSIPEGVDVSGVDFDFLASQFALAGGHIRSIVFNACLASAATGREPSLPMRSILAALKWEYEKLHRTLNREQFGPHREVWDEVERGEYA